MTTERLVPGTPSWRASWVDHHQRYEFFAQRCRGRRVLDVACGAGYGSSLLATGGAALAVGVDIAAEAVAVAKRHYRHPAIALAVADAARLPFPAASFDAVVSFETIEHLARPERLVEEAERVLRPGGLFVCSTPNIERHSRAGVVNEFHLCELELDEFRRLVEARFDIEAVWCQTESPAFRRHAELVREVAHLYSALASSLAARLERRLRRLIGRPRPIHALHGDILEFVPGDFVIEPLDSGSESPKTYIVTATKRPR